MTKSSLRRSRLGFVTHVQFRGGLITGLRPQSHNKVKHDLRLKQLFNNARVGTSFRSALKNGFRLCGWSTSRHDFK